MTQKIVATVALAFGLALIAVPTLAHHSSSAEFDAEKNITIAGTITKVDWINPHIYIYVDVKDDKGNVTNWSVESVPPRLMHQTNMSKEMFGIGQEVTISGYRAKDGTKNLAWMNSVTFADGRSWHLGQ